MQCDCTTLPEAMRPEKTGEGQIFKFHYSGVAQWLACWAHNPKVRGSKPRSAKRFLAPCSFNSEGASSTIQSSSAPCSSTNDPGRTRTCNPRLRRPMPYPLGHGATFAKARLELSYQALQCPSQSCRSSDTPRAHILFTTQLSAGDLSAFCPRRRCFLGPSRQQQSMSTPGVEPGLSRPQRDVLTTRRCGHMLSPRKLPSGAAEAKAA